MTPDCRRDPCQLCLQRAVRADCSCDAGILIVGTRVRACSDCRLFDTDKDAAAAVVPLLQVLNHLYAQQGQTVADALDDLFWRCGVD